MTVTPLIWTLVFLAGFMLVEFLAFATAGMRARNLARSRRRMRELAGRLHADVSAEEVSILREVDGMGTGLLGQLTASLPFLEPLELLLYRAGRPFSLLQFLLLSLGLALCGAAIGNFVLFDPTLGALLTTAGLLPVFYVERRKRRRMKQFDVMFPEALDLLARALRAGHAMSSGLQMVGRELGDPIGPEFAQVADEMQFGLDLSLALANLSYRIDIPDMPFFVTALLIQRETGGNLAEIMDNLGKVIRERHAIYGKIRSLTAQTRWSANILLIAPFAFVGLMTLARPDYVEPLFETRGGNVVLAVCTVMVLVGYALCRRVGVVRV